jgi:hypothetical protein
MPNLAQLKQEQKFKGLFYGDSGAGKTVLATGFPGKVFVCDFDGKVSSAAQYYGARNPARLEQIDYEDYRPAPGTTPNEGFVRFYGKLVGLEKEAKEGKFSYETVVLDSLTTWYDAVMAQVIRDNPNSKRRTFEGASVPMLEDYNFVQLRFKETLKRVLNLPCNVIMIAHISVDKDDSTGEVLRQPSITGKNLAPWLPIVFEEVWRIYANEKGERFAQTQPDTKFSKIRTQVPGIPAHVPLSGGFEALNKYLGLRTA